MNEAARLVARWYFREKHRLEVPFDTLVSLTRDIYALKGEIRARESTFNVIADALDAAYAEINGVPLSQSIRMRESS